MNEFNTNTSSTNDDLNELRLTEGICVWTQNQELLEEQALKELEIFASENVHQCDTDAIEEGEVVDDTDSKYSKIPEPVLDINSYIQKQKELKKRQDFKKSLEVSDQSIKLANKICKQNIHVKKRKKVENNFSETLQRNPSISKDVPQGDTFIEEENNLEDENKSGSEYFPSENEHDSDYEPGYSKKTENNCDAINNKPQFKRKRKVMKQDIKIVKDDGLISCYKSRLNAYYKVLEEENEIKVMNNNDNDEDVDDHVIKGGLKVPVKLWNKLYSYQQDAIEWLWKLHQKPTGGLLGDEMGLGKTVEIIAFLHAVEHSKIPSLSGRCIGIGATLIVCPVTVIHQWVQHFHEWSPEFRVAVLHQSGSFQGNKANLIREINKARGILVTTYIGILKYKGNLIEHNWHYIILDEGHKIRNPTAKVSVAIKQLRTPHRILLSGSPMQNNLTELWSLFDFTNPGMLGTLQTFQEHFANPILHGGFANATPMQEATALTVATTLKNIITPYLLRRSKAEVQHHISLPNKSEQVLFCSLTHEQKDLYKGYLMSEHVNMILGRGKKNWFSENHMRSNVLVGITTLRKICNHPDIYLFEADEATEKENENVPLEEKFGYYKRSGKMIVVSALLKIWKKQKHRVLLFTQGRAMITIFQDFLEQHGYKYLKMDGSTSVTARQPLINKFNQDTSYDVFLSTTRVGGLGVNLTGANRVIIFDPDWNPATDTQARERAWRIGQEKQVTVYRLLSAGTIEEKMYQRQVWKQLLSNKVLLDPKTQRFFKSSDLYDLFSLQESQETETANIFHDSRVKLQQNIKKKKKSKTKLSKDTSQDESSSIQFSEDKIEAMKRRAQQISQSISSSSNDSNTSTKKDAYQLELEEERMKKLKEKQELKKLSAAELMAYNKMKLTIKDDDSKNKIDGVESDASFSKALDYSSKTASLYHDMTSGKIKMKEILKKKKELEEVGSMKEDRNSSKSSKSKHKHKVLVDTSGTIDGEEVEGLVKSEFKKNKAKIKSSKTNEKQDDYVLNQLFTKKGVSGALQHDSIVQSGSKHNNLRIHTEAKLRADKSLEALRKSRLHNWSW